MRQLLPSFLSQHVYRAYTARSPLAHAIFRTAELKCLGEVDKAVVLDLGCGVGEFADAAVRIRLTVGLDVAGRKLLKARQTAKYAHVCQGDARALPFADACFGSIVCISVMEHIRRPRQVLAEAFRTLQPGGVFVGTLVLNDLHRHLFYPRFLRRVGLGCLIQPYVRAHDRLFKHHTLLSEGDWRHLWQEAGFEVIDCQRVVSPRITRLWDMMLPLAFPYWLGRKLGLNLVWHPRWMVRWLENILAEERAPINNTGSCLFFVLRKPEAAVDGSYAVHLPEAARVLQEV